MSAAAVVLTVALIVTILGNMPITFWTGRSPEGAPPPDFEIKRRRWDVFQAVRGSLQLLGFVLVCVAVST